MQHDSQVCDDVAPPAASRQQGLRSCPVPPDVLKGRDDERKYLDLRDMLHSIQEISVPKIEREDSPADQSSEEEILV
jgi:hypothetical protein